MAKAIEINVAIAGPFFVYGDAPIKEATAELIADLIKEGEAKVEAQLYPGHGYRTGEYKSTIHSQIVNSLHGEIDQAPDGREAIIGKFLELGRYWPSTGHRFKGLFMFRKAAQHLSKITREVAGKHYARAIKRLT